MSPTSPRSAVREAGLYVVARVRATDRKVVLMEEPVKLDPDQLLTGPECARLAGVAVNTWRSLVSKGYAPKADEPDLDRPPHMRMPRWKASAVVAFRDNRPGRTGRPKKIRTEADGGDK